MFQQFHRILFDGDTVHRKTLHFNQLIFEVKVPQFSEPHFDFDMHHHSPSRMVFIS